MAFIILPHRWKRQPQYRVGVNWANPLTRGLSFLWMPQSHTDLVSGKVGTPTNFTAGPYDDKYGGGLYRQTNGAANEGLDFGTAVRPITSSTAFTVGTYAAPANSATRKVPFSQRLNTGGIEQVDLLFGVTGSFIVNASAVTLFTRNTAGTSGYGDNRTGFPGAPDGSWHLWAGTWDNAVPAVWRDGVDIHTDVSAPSGTLVSASQKTRIGNLGDYTTDGAWASTCPFGLVAVWGDRALNEPELRAWNENPWQLFAPIHRKIYFNTVAAGGITGTLDVTLDAVTLSSTGTLPIVGALDKTLDDVTLSGTGTLPAVGTLDVTLDAVTLSAAGAGLGTGALAVTLDAITLSSTGTLPIVGTFSKTLGDVTLDSQSTNDTPVVAATATTPGGVGKHKRKRRPTIIQYGDERYIAETEQDAEDIIAELLAKEQAALAEPVAVPEKPKAIRIRHAPAPVREKAVKAQEKIDTLRLHAARLLEQQLELQRAAHEREIEEDDAQILRLLQAIENDSGRYH